MLSAATPALTLTNAGPIDPGTLLTFGGAGLDGQDTPVSPDINLVDLLDSLKGDVL